MAPPRKIGRDTGLTARMTLTFFLLGALYVVLIGAMFAAGASGILIAVIAGGLLLLQLFASDKLALHAMGAREVSPQEAPELHAMIERLCVQADLPKPRVAVAKTRDAQRLRPRPLAEERHRLRDHGDHGAALARRARGRDGARAHPRRRTAT